MTTTAGFHSCSGIILTSSPLHSVENGRMPWCDFICTLGSLWCDNSCCKIALCVSVNVLWLFRGGHVVEIRQRALSLSWQEEWFSCKEWKIYCCTGLALAAEPQIWQFHIIIWKTMPKTCIKECAAHAARLFLLIQAIKLLIFGDALSLLSSFLKIPINPWKAFLCCWGVSKLWRAWEDVELGFVSRRLLDVGSFVLSYFTQE